MIQRRTALAGAHVLTWLVVAGCSGSAFSSATGTGSSLLDGGAASGDSSAGGASSGGASSASGGMTSGGTTSSGGSGSGGLDGSVTGEAGVVSPPDSGIIGAGGVVGAGGLTGAGGVVMGTGGVVMGTGGVVMGTGGTPGCTDPPTWYRDKDLDGYGVTTVSKVACDAPAPSGWSQVAGDCQDDNAEVHPGQTAYFAQPYGTSGPDSYDYDCSGTEDGDPALPVAGTACVGSVISGCSGAGYQPVSGNGHVNALCGSQKGMICTNLAVGCVSGAASNLKPYTCR